MEVVRLFVAVAIPDAVKERLAAFQERLRATDAHVNWTRADGIHITLKFLGEVESGRIPEIGVAIGHAVNGFSPFTLQAAGTGMFPNASKPRVAWAGLTGETKKLIHLQRRVEAEFEAIGFSHEKRAFTPHVTLGRVRSDKNVRALAEAMAKADGKEFGVIEVDRLILFRSDLTPDGANYTAVLEEPFRF